MSSELSQEQKQAKKKEENERRRSNSDKLVQERERNTLRRAEKRRLARLIQHDPLAPLADREHQARMLEVEDVLDRIHGPPLLQNDNMLLHELEEPMELGTGGFEDDSVIFNAAQNNWDWDEGW